MIPVSSSNIAAVGYDGITLIHSDREYAYYGIPASIYQALLTAPSHGKYHAQHIKHAFPYQRIR